MKKLIAIFCLIVCVSCLNQPKPLPLSDKEVAFKKLISKLKIVPYPISYAIYESIDDKKVIYLNDDSNDTLLRKDFGGDVNPVNAIWGLLPDTSESYKILAFYPADVLFLGVVTFDKKGNLLDSYGLNSGKWGADVCYNCSETIIIKSLNDILCTDTITEMIFDTIEHKCIDSTRKITIENKYYSLTQQGKLISK